MKIGIDVDGVLVDIVGYQKKYGRIYFEEKRHIKSVNPQGYDIHDIYGVSKEEREKFWIKYIWRYCLKEPMLEGASETVAQLKQCGHKIIIVTGRAHTTENNIMGVVFRWMLKHWLKKNHFEYDKIFYCSEKDSATDKYDVCMREKIDVLIDDKPENLLAVKGKIGILCYSAVWNEDCKELDEWRVKDWGEVEKRIEEIEERGNI